MSFRPPALEPLQIDGAAGALEALLERPGAADAEPVAFAVVCHPHPLHGGTMHNKVVHMLARTLQERGWPTLRFNYRGVGASAGSFDEGRGETEDALAVIRWGRRRWPQLPLMLAGFSFGSMVAMRAATRSTPRRLITVAPAVANPGFEGITAPACPWLLVQGDADEVVDPQAVIGFAAGFGSAVQLRVLPGVGHFFHGRLDELRRVTGEFLDQDPLALPAQS